MRVTVIILASERLPDVDERVRQVQQAARETIVAIDGPPYGLALKRDLARAADQGFTHAIAFDIARHSLDDLPRFFEAIEKHPGAIITGVRPHKNGAMPLPARVARFFADLWTWGESRRWTRDSPHGYRAYPLEICSDLVLRSDRLEIDVELLVKSIWAGVDVVQIPLSPLPKDQLSSKLLPITQLARFAGNSMILLTHRLLLPAPMLETMYRKGVAHLGFFRQTWQFARDAIAHHSAYPAKFSAAVGVGVFFGIVPLWGIQMIVASLVAHFLGLSKAIVVASSNISFPAMLPFIVYASLLIGHLLHTGQMKDLPKLSELTPSTLLQSLGEYVIGSIVLAVAAGLLAFAFSYVSATIIRVVGIRRLRRADPC